MAAWEAMGNPEPPTREQARLLREAASATKKESFTADESGRFELKRQIDPWSVVLIQER